MPVVRTDGRTSGRWCTVTLLANFLGWVDYHISLAMGLQRRAWDSGQSGFRRKHGTETALIKTIEELLFNLDKDRVSGMVLVDYRKAFDIVDHELLLRKLKVYGVANQELNWCRSFLCSRKQVVHVRGRESGEAMLRYGVPQGSIIGPLFRKYSPNRDHYGFRMPHSLYF